MDHRILAREIPSGWFVCAAAMLFLCGCHQRGYPPVFEFEEMHVVNDVLTCRTVLATSPMQVLSDYRTRYSGDTCYVTIYVRGQRSGGDTDRFTYLQIPVPTGIDRVVLTDGETRRELWERPDGGVPDQAPPGVSPNRDR